MTLAEYAGGCHESASTNCRMSGEGGHRHLLRRPAPARRRQSSAIIGAQNRLRRWLRSGSPRYTAGEMMDLRRAGDLTTGLDMLARQHVGGQ
jgi:hypothetical protein